jgi:Polyphosphate kinase 2 (PPK2)
MRVFHRRVATGPLVATGRSDPLAGRLNAPPSFLVAADVDDRVRPAADYPPLMELQDRVESRFGLRGELDLDRDRRVRQKSDQRSRHTSLCSFRRVRRRVAGVFVDRIAFRCLLPVAVAHAVTVQRVGDVVQGQRQLFKRAPEQPGLTGLHRQPEPPDGRTSRLRPTKKPRHAGLSQCAREDSNLHGPFSPQGPQPESPRVDGCSRVRGPQIEGFSARIRPPGKGGCCHGCCHESHRLVSENGFRIVKVFLNLSKEEQRTRFPRRLDLPDHNWKFSIGGRSRARAVEDFQKPFSEMLSRTSTEWAPWYVTRAERKWFASGRSRPRTDGDQSRVSGRHLGTARGKGDARGAGTQRRARRSVRARTEDREGGRERRVERARAEYGARGAR